MTTLRVALVDDHLLFREGLRAMLASAPDLRVVAEASNAQEALPAVRASQPEVVVLDVMLPGVSGIGVARELLREDPKRKVLALSMVADEAHVAGALQAGVLGYACKSQSAAEVMEAIRTVARGETYLAPQVSGFLVSDYRRGRNGKEPALSPIASLTARAGYIGSGVVGERLRSGHSALVYDSLYKGHRDAVHPEAEFVHAGLLDAGALSGALHRADAVVHMAADSLVGESVQEPAKYF